MLIHTALLVMVNRKNVENIEDLLILKILFFFIYIYKEKTE